MRLALILLCCWPMLSFGQLSIEQQEAKRAQFQMNAVFNPATQNYDLIYCRLEIEVDPSDDFIAGEVTPYFKAEGPMSQIVFDLKNNMSVAGVEQQGNALAYSHDGDDLIIDLPQNIADGTIDSLTINYSGTPDSGGFGYFEQSQHNGDEIIWTLSEPYGAKYWWPTKQDRRDKIDSLDVFITFPNKNSNGKSNVAVSNGIERSQHLDGTMKTTHFHHGYPIPAYLVAIAVSNYSVFTQQVENNGNPFDIVNYVYPEDENAIQQQTNETADIMEFYSDKFGEYPYSDEKYGHCQFGWGGGMEHTTVSFMGGFGYELIAHEMAHQWFGDAVTCASWQDVWLNEGFANFSYGLLLEEFNGTQFYRQWRADAVQHITSEPGGSVYVPADQLTDVNRIFDSRLSYDKGAMVLHMLRRKLGDADFFQALKNYLNNPDYSFGYADTEDFKTELESQSGLALSDFFDQWIYGEGFPTYHLSWFQNDADQVYINLDQDQSKPTSVSFYKGAVPLRFESASGESLDTVLEMTQSAQAFTVNPDFEVNNVLIDPDVELISGENSVELGVNSPDGTDFVIYPNPAQTDVYIGGLSGISVQQITIYNAAGQTVKKGNTDHIEVGNLEAGLYFVSIKTSGNRVIKSLIIE